MLNKKNSIVLFALATLFFMQSCTMQEDKYIEEEISKNEIQVKLDDKKESDQKRSESKTESNLNLRNSETDSKTYKADDINSIDQGNTEAMQNDDSKDQNIGSDNISAYNDLTDLEQQNDMDGDLKEQESSVEDYNESDNNKTSKTDIKEQQESAGKINRCSANTEKFYEQAGLDNQDSPL